MEFTLGKALKREGISQKRFRDVLAERYDYDRSLCTINMHCNAMGIPNTPCWEIIRRCLDREFGIVYYKGGWERKENI